MATEKVSQRFNLTGWKLGTWAKKNKDSLKLIASGLFGIAGAAVSGLSPTWSVPLGGVVAAVSKLVLDTFDYWQSE